MYGAIPTEPVTPDGDAGVLFMHNEGWSTMCGHGVIALVTVALSFREPEWDLTRAEDTAVRWGFPIRLAELEMDEEDPTSCPACAAPLPDAPGNECENCGYEGPPFTGKKPKEERPSQ